MRSEEEVRELLKIQYEFLNKSTCEKEFIKGQISAFKWVLEDEQ